MKRAPILKEFLHFLRTGQRWWIAPIVLVLALLGALLMLAEGSALSPFLYRTP